ncbi:MAG: isochorismatase family protein [Gammaproteobacteria bacterium]|nr:isochorismatase family protein [Gammaproteobacteria bacterium]
MRASETVISKQYASAFFGTPLAATLHALGVDTLLIAGVSTSGCVRATAVDACQHGFVPLVVREAVGDRHPAPHEANLFDLQAKYAEVISLEAAAAYRAQCRYRRAARTRRPARQRDGHLVAQPRAPHWPAASAA